MRSFSRELVRPLYHFDITPDSPSSGGRQSLLACLKAKLVCESVKCTRGSAAVGVRSVSPPRVGLFACSCSSRPTAGPSFFRFVRNVTSVSSAGEKDSVISYRSLTELIYITTGVKMTVHFMLSPRRPALISWPTQKQNKQITK